MVRKPQYAKPALAIVKLDDVPGPEAEADTLNEHYQRVQTIFACRRYDDVVMACHWCCDSENDLVFSKKDKARGTRMFCSARCANSHNAYEIKVWRNLGKAIPSRSVESGESVNDTYDPVSTEHVKTKRPAKATVKAATPSPLDDGEVDEEKPAWKPVGERGRKPRKARATKPQRTDGKCSKGEHEMTEANTYEYGGGTWCRECRKVSRAASAAKRSA